jgi:hypothetical protein
MFQLLVSMTVLPLFAADGSFTVDCPHPDPAHVELTTLFLKTAKSFGETS